MAYTNVLCIKWLLYYWRCSFSDLELHVRYNCQAVVPNTNTSLFPMFVFVYTCMSMHNLKTTTDIQIIDISNNYSTTLPI